MKVAIHTPVLNTTLTRVHHLFYGFIVFTSLGFLGEVFSSQVEGWGAVFWGVVIGLSLRSFHQVLTNLQYSFWTFAFSFSLYILLSMMSAESGFIANCYFIALILLAILCIIISSPLFYPRIYWWEYDFRFRGELKVDVHKEKQSFPGRLTDLRRKAGCIVLFQRLTPGTQLSVDYKSGEKTSSYSIKIISRRSSILGRGYTYGVQFLFSEEEDEERFQRLSNLWRTIKKVKRLAKFQEID
ncbi:MAG: PilZ domain-containing protein [Bacteriovoracales bacterium]|nr:PilZ domain-containing protein [Bacteriovoracales bacterium]